MKKSKPAFIDGDNRPALCIGAGPSFEEDAGNLVEFKGTFFVSDRMLSRCVDIGIIPDYVVTLDGQQIVKNYFDKSTVRKCKNKTTLIISSMAHPDVVRAWRGKTMFYHGMIDNPNISMSVSRMFYLIAREFVGREFPLFSTMGNVGDLCWWLAAVFRFNPVILLGIDHGYRGDERLERSRVVKQVIDRGGSRRDILQLVKRKVNPFGEEVWSDYIKESFTETFIEWASKTDKTRTIQAGRYASLFGGSIECERLTDILSELESHKEISIK